MNELLWTILAVLGWGAFLCLLVLRFLMDFDSRINGETVKRHERNEEEARAALRNARCEFHDALRVLAERAPAAPKGNSP